MIHRDCCGRAMRSGPSPVIGDFLCAFKILAGNYSSPTPKTLPAPRSDNLDLNDLINNRLAQNSLAPGQMSYST
jgi:hypothetical protein